MPNYIDIIKVLRKIISKDNVDSSCYICATARTTSYPKNNMLAGQKRNPNISVEAKFKY